MGSFLYSGLSRDSRDYILAVRSLSCASTFLCFFLYSHSKCHKNLQPRKFRSITDDIFFPDKTAPDPSLLLLGLLVWADAPRRV